MRYLLRCRFSSRISARVGTAPLRKVTHVVSVSLLAGDKEEEEEEEEDERNNNEPRPVKMNACRDGAGLEDVADASSALLGGPTRPEDQLFTAFAYNSASKRLTMIPVKYKMKEERRKVLKISINKLKKIDDPESWLCRSVLINNTMKKLQKEARDEKMQKQMNAYAKSYLLKSPVGLEADDFNGQLNNNNQMNGDLCPLKLDDQDCFYQKEFVQKEKEDVFCQLGAAKDDDEFEFGGKEKEPEEERTSRLPDESCISNGVPLNEDFVEKIPSIKRCASRKRSLDEDGTASEILNLDETDLEVEAKRPRLEADDVDECDVHDVLSQLYMPPTPRMLTSIDSDTDDDDLNVVDIDSSYIDSLKTECQNKLPSAAGTGDGLFDAKRKASDPEDEQPSSKRKLTDDIFSCFNVSCDTYFMHGEKGNFDNFLCNNKGKDKDRTSVESCGKSDARAAKPPEEEELIELEDEEDIKRRLSQSLSSHYQRKSDKSCESFFEDGCDNQYSCGHTVNMFNDIQSVTFHNLIASLET